MGENLALLEDGAPSLSTRDKVFALEAHVREMEQVDCPVTHHFSPGVYAREVFIPKGAVVVGKIHKYPHLSIMSSGELSIVLENETIRVKAPFSIVSPAGTKRAVLAHEDTVWTTIHATDEIDVAKIEAHFIAQDEAEYVAHCEQLQIGSN